MFVVTGAAGFIGSCMVSFLNQQNIKDIVIVDDFTKENKNNNFSSLKYSLKLHRNDFIEWFSNNASLIEGVFHLGARTDTTEFDWNIFLELNVEYSKSIWNICVSNNIPLIYASSAATYGNGEFGYDDDHSKINSLKPLNPYGQSKHQFDLWVLGQTNLPPFWAGLKFFNVYGPNEFHKQRMASVIFHSFNQINQDGVVKLFKSHRDDYENGMQLRDFVYVKDLVSVMSFLMSNKPESGIYNLGTGKARSFYDLAIATFEAMGVDPNIEFIDIPFDIRDKYQYFTQANMSKLINSGYKTPFYSLEEGVKDYVQKYLMTQLYY